MQNFIGLKNLPFERESVLRQNFGAFTAENIIDMNGVSVEAASRPGEIYSMDLTCKATLGDLLRVRVKTQRLLR